MTDPINPGDLCMVVRNTTGHPCIEANIGQPVRVVARHAVFMAFYGISFAWSIQTPHQCRRCGDEITGHYEGDLQPIRGAGGAQQLPTTVDQTCEATA